MMTYQEQIKHPKWQKKRLQVLNAHKFKCQVCGAKEEELHVHHPYYKRGAMIWEYKKEELECLCHRCHKNAHAIDEKIKKALALCSDKQRVLDFILTVNGSPSQANPSKTLPSPVVIEQIGRKTPRSSEERDKEDTILYGKYPFLRPDPTDSDDEKAKKFFQKMKLLMG